MPCKTFIHDHLYTEAEQRSRQGLGYNIQLAKKFEKEVNDLFYEPVVRFFLNGDFVDRDITISDSLVEFHYNKQLSDKANTDKQSFVEDVILNAGHCRFLTICSFPLFHRCKREYWLGV